MGNLLLKNILQWVEKLGIPKHIFPHLGVFLLKFKKTF